MTSFDLVPRGSYTDCVHGPPYHHSSLPTLGASVQRYAYGLGVPSQSFYPTPPPSPDLVELLVLPDHPCPSTSTLVPDLKPVKHAPTVPTWSSQSNESPVIPIALLLSTSHHLPFASTLRLGPPTSILQALGGNRVLQLDSSVLDRMPYTAATASLPRDTDEDHVEAMIGGERPEVRPNGLHWAMRNSSIFVHPPTPERVVSPIERSLPSSSLSFEPDANPETSPLLHTHSLPKTHIAVPIQVLQQVRSPPKKTIAMAVDSLAIAQNRGRRTKLFGFTEMSESSGSSANNSANNSRSNSPERPAVVIPRRQPSRTKSDTSLSTYPHTIHHPPRRRDTGLKLDFSGIVPLTTSPSEVEAAVVPSPYSAALIRKKSGEILKPALKHGAPLGPNGTPIQQGPPRLSKSLPATPSCPKYVHFDSQLTRVKTFVKDQKPLVVSAPGSPVDTSEGEEYPFPSTDEEKESRVLTIRLPNFSTYHPPDADLFLESLFLDDDRKSLKGVVLCRNIAFQKWVAVRFTLDWWQTTSEVTAMHKDSVRNGTYDRFSFTIKLNDFLSRIEEKTLFLAIRYNTDGKEIWDSNGGQNYQVLFEKTWPTPQRKSSSIQAGMGMSVGGKTSQWRDTDGPNRDRMADLRAKLNVIADGDATSPPQVSPVATRQRSMSPGHKITFGVSPGSSPRFSDAKPELPAAGPGFGARYDFGMAFNHEKTRRNSMSPRPTSKDLPDLRTGLLSYAKNEAHSPAFYSPRDDHFFSPAAAGLPVPSVRVQGPSPPIPDVDSPSPQPKRRPSITRSVTTPAHFVTSPPSSTSDTPADSPKSLPDWSPPTDKTKDAELSRQTYESYMAKWSSQYPSYASSTSTSDGSGSASNWSSPLVESRRSHSTTSLDAYFSSPEKSISGGSTPKANGTSSAHQTSPSASSYFASFSSTPRREQKASPVVTSVGASATGKGNKDVESMVQSLEALARGGGGFGGGGKRDGRTRMGDVTPPTPSVAAQ